MGAPQSRPGNGLRGCGRRDRGSELHLGGDLDVCRRGRNANGLWIDPAGIGGAVLAASGQAEKKYWNAEIPQCADTRLGHGHQGVGPRRLPIHTVGALTWSSCLERETGLKPATANQYHRVRWGSRLVLVPL